MWVRSPSRRSWRPAIWSSCWTICRPGTARRCRTERAWSSAITAIGRRLPRFSPRRRSRRSSIAPHAHSSANRWWSPPATSGTTWPAASRCSRPHGRSGVDRFVLSSTAAVYGVPDATPITEDAPLRPINPYGETKRSFEGALDWYARAYGLRSVSLRYFNVAGATDAIGEDHDPETHLIPAILQAVDAGRRLTLFGDDYPTRDGTCVRDYIHVSDLADAHLLALEATVADDERTGDGLLACNLGNGEGATNLEVIAAAEAVVGRPIDYEVGPRRPGDPPVLVASAERAKAVLGWVARRPDLEEMVGSAWAWRRRHPDGYAD